MSEQKTPGTIPVVSVSAFVALLTSMGFLFVHELAVGPPPANGEGYYESLYHQYMKINDTNVKALGYADQSIKIQDGIIDSLNNRIDVLTPKPSLMISGSSISGCNLTSCNLTGSVPIPSPKPDDLGKMTGSGTNAPTLGTPMFFARRQCFQAYSLSFNVPIGTRYCITVPSEMPKLPAPEGWISVEP